MASSLTAGRVPQPRGVIARGGDHAGAVGTEGGVLDRVLMSAQGGQQLTAGRIPQPRGLIPRGGDHAGAIGTEGGVPDRALMAG